VKNKDGNWRLCVDFKGLNKQTVQDRFPIPLVKDLMDEFGGSIVYSKLDLRFGYHRVRMALGEEYKTTSKTHTGHYEYMVMPFGLTNALATFQAHMNVVFHSYLRKFVTVFFDDILIYSSSFDLHLQHLRLVFQLLRDHQFFLKKSKCNLAAPLVEYLRHTISKG